MSRQFSFFGFLTEHGSQQDFRITKERTFKVLYKYKHAHQIKSVTENVTMDQRPDPTDTHMLIFSVSDWT